MIQFIAEEHERGAAAREGKVRQSDKVSWIVGIRIWPINLTYPIFSCIENKRKEQRAVCQFIYGRGGVVGKFILGAATSDCHRRWVHALAGCRGSLLQVVHLRGRPRRSKFEHVWKLRICFRNERRWRQQTSVNLWCTTGCKIIHE